MSSDSRLKFTKRSGVDRGHENKGWLQTFYSFSFEEHVDNRNTEWGPLRVLNEDFVAKGKGFGEHEHEEFEIWTYIVKGELTHRDNHGHTEVLQAGDVQYSSAGTGIRHSESNDNRRKNLHVLQIWAKPAQAALQPTYYTRRFPAERKQDMFCPVLVPARSFTDLSAVPGQDTSSSDPIPCFANLSMSAALISPGTTLATRVYGKKAYLHLVMRSGYVTPESGMARGRLVIKSDRGDVVMHEGDGAKVVGPGITGKACELVLTNDGESMAELILIDA